MVKFAIVVNLSPTVVNLASPGIPKRDGTVFISNRFLNELKFKLVKRDTLAFPDFPLFVNICTTPLEALEP
ncbi:hypothetical protein D3C83_175970 [compost metagenome]